MLYIHRAERADALVEALASILAKALEDPFASEVVAVPTRGIERWLSQRISHRLGTSPDRDDGICANLDFPFPGSLVGQALSAATGLDPDADPWVPERSVWPLLNVVERFRSDAWMQPLRRYLGLEGAGEPDPSQSRRFAAVRHIADLYDRYSVHRPEMLRAWAHGDDVDASGRALAADGAWQPELWRRLRQAIGEPSPAERLEQACARLRGEPGLVGWPARISLFPLTRIPSSYLEVLTAIAAGRDVHLFVLHPSPALWDRVASSPGNGPDDAAAAVLPRHPILGSWGRDARELQLVLAGCENCATQHHATEAPPASLLGLLQAGVRDDLEPPGPPLPGAEDTRPLLDLDDRSVQVHACHGRARQVEVIRDAILHLLQQDPTLEPRDVIVMCPDIETYAPLIQASFGAGELLDEEDQDMPPPRWRPADLRVRLADRSLRQTNPVLGAVAQLLELAQARVTASELLSFADREPVRRRFGFDDQSLDRIQGWVVAAGIHWGLDAEHRTAFKLGELSEGTWRAGLDRILLGVTMTEDGLRLLGGVLPLDDVDSQAIGLAGRFAEYVDRVEAALDGLSQPKTVDAWATAITRAADLLTLTRDWESWQRTELARLLDDVSTEASVGGEASAVVISLPEIRALLADRLRGRPTRANFRTGHLTICTLVPMRSVPHRVICLLGLDDGEFPRKSPRDGDDLVLEARRIGDRDPRTEDRQMLLDALMAAGEHLVISYSGHDERTNLPRPPCVPLGELLDCIDRTVRTPGGDPARARVRTAHPLQPFDQKNFEPGALAPSSVWSFDRTALEGARALAGAQHAPPAFLERALPGVAGARLELGDLVRFVDRPISAFLRQRLGITVRDDSEQIDDRLPLELDHLAKWSVGQRLLDARLSGLDWQSCIRAEVARGGLPPGLLGVPVVREEADTIEALAVETQALRNGRSSESLDVKVALPGGRLLVGTVGDVYGELLQTVTYSRLNAQHRLAAWVRLLALSAARPERPWETAALGRGRPERSRAALSISRVAPLGTDAGSRGALALEYLGVIADLYDRGMREPLPIARRSSAVYAAGAFARDDGDAAWEAARGEWESDYDWSREDVEAWHRLVFGGVVSFAELFADHPRSDESGTGWEPSESSRFGRLARRLWDRLLAHEQVSDL